MVDPDKLESASGENPESDPLGEQLKAMAAELEKQQPLKPDQESEKVFDVERDVTKEDMEYGLQYYRQITEGDSKFIFLSYLKGVDPNLDVQPTPETLKRISEKLDSFRPSLSSEFWQTAKFAKAIRAGTDLQLPSDAQDRMQEKLSSDEYTKHLLEYGSVEFVEIASNIKDVDPSIHIDIMTEERKDALEKNLLKLRDKVLKQPGYSTNYLAQANAARNIEPGIDVGLNDEVLQAMKNQLNVLRDKASVNPKEWSIFFALAAGLKKITSQE